MSSSDITDIRVLQLFDGEARYVIPVYQRNYAWGKEQIQALIEDIKSNENDHYYLGTLVVSKKPETDNVYEVIDGQQRLTTLFLLFQALFKSESEKIKLDVSCLAFEARDISNRLLRNPESDMFREEGHEISIGYEIIKTFLNNKNDFGLEPSEFIDKLNKAVILRVPVPEYTDLNHYFEIMNTRGEQLELHEIAKSRFIEKFGNDQTKNIVARIWDACSDMSRYVQTRFSARAGQDHKSIRERLFGEKWNSFPCKDFGDIVDNWLADNADSKSEDDFLQESLSNILLDENVRKFESKRKKNKDGKQDDEEGSYDSIIRFSDLLLHVLLITRKEDVKKLEGKSEGEKKLDDKALLKHVDEYLSDEESAKESAEGKAKKFIYNLLKYRYYFDKYIIKRDFSKKRDGEWSLRKYGKDGEGRGREINLLPSRDNQDEPSVLNGQLLTLESCCRITYTSPKAMYWITEVLRNIPDDESLKEEDVAKKLLGVLEGYCVGKLKEARKEAQERDKDWNEANPFGTGFAIRRIVFSYLDYLLCKKDNEYKKFDFKFRNSVEHFYPQNPDTGKKLEDEKVWLDNFGNLALITVSGNSKFSNVPPKAKGDYEDIINQSLKLREMCEIVGKEGKWEKDEIEKHNREMIEILDDAIKKQETSQQAGVDMIS